VVGDARLSPEEKTKSCSSVAQTLDGDPEQGGDVPGETTKEPGRGEEIRPVRSPKVTEGASPKGNYLRSEREGGEELEICEHAPPRRKRGGRASILPGLFHGLTTREAKANKRQQGSIKTSPPPTP